MSKVAQVKYRIKKYGKWMPEERSEFKIVKLSGVPTLTFKEDIIASLKKDGIKAVEVMIEKIK